MPDFGYARSFEVLGYKLKAARNQWSASSETGVCLSLWSKEMRSENDLLELDTRLDCGPIEDWPLAGKVKRSEHLKLAVGEFDRWIDVVIRQGGPEDESVPTAPWIVSKRKNYKWRLCEFDPTTGHFSAKIEEFIDKSSSE